MAALACICSSDHDEDCTLLTRSCLLFFSLPETIPPDYMGECRLNLRELVTGDHTYRGREVALPSGTAV